ncbi:sensor histidine kinase [Salipaludibacillus sp. HK11]|uniref:sensor histidine kinase n=1 Tax=Salipaludibacillus sp. HK11 TaxID=3394320 RepID=UPI0039FDCE36
MNIRKRFYTLFFTLVIIPLLLIGWMTYEFSSTIYRGQISEHMQDTLESIDLNINTLMSEVEMFTEYVVTSSPVLHHLSLEEWPTAYEKNRNEDTISRLAFSNRLVNDFYLLSERDDQDNLHFLIPPETRFENLEESIFMEEVQKRRGNTYWIGPASEELEEENAAFFTVGRSVIHPQSLEELGQFFLFVSPDLLQTANSLGDNSETEWIIVNHDGETIYNTAPELLGEMIDLRQIEDNVDGTYYNNKGDEFLYTSKSGFQDWTLISFKTMESMNAILLPVRFFTVGIVSTLLVMLLLFHKFFSQRLIQFIQRFKEGMTKAAEGNLSVRMEPYKEEEFTMLTTSFNDMVTQLRSTIQQVEKEQEQKQDAEFKVLQHQINPHFLYNTLESVNALASLNKMEEVQRLVTNLGKLLRISLNGPNEIPLKEELKHVTSYLEIQKIRHSNRFHYDVKMEDNTVNIPVLKLILQPLVENAIEHGRKYASFHRIEIETLCSEEALILRITDDGPGFPKEVLDHLNKRSSITAFTGHGVLNVHDRIQLYYREQSGLIICSEPGHTTIQIRIPLHQEEEA